MHSARGCARWAFHRPIAIAMGLRRGIASGELQDGVGMIFPSSIEIDDRDRGQRRLEVVLLPT